MESTNYTVQPGNTLWGIANFFGVSTEELIKLNDLTDPEMIYPGQVIVIPVSKPMPPKYYTVRPGDTLFYIAKRYGLTVEEILMLNNPMNPNLIFPGQILRLQK